MKMSKRLLSGVLAGVLGAAVLAAPVLSQQYTSFTTKLKNNLWVLGTITTGPVGSIATVVSTTGNANGQVAKAKEFDVNIGPGQALANSTTFSYVVAPGRAGTVTLLSLAALVKPAGGTNTLAIKKNNGNTMLSTATFDPTTIGANNVSQPLTLTSTAADLTLTATDTITVIYTSGVQTTAAQAPTLTIEMLPTDY